MTIALHFRLTSWLSTAGLSLVAAAALAAPCDPAAAARVCRGTLQRTVLLTGELEAVRGEAVSVPRTPAWRVAIRWMADDGSRVHAGDTVLELDSSEFAADLEEKRLARQRAAEELERQRAAAEAEREQQRFAVEKARVEEEKARIAAAVPVEVLSQRERQERLLALRRAEVEHTKARTVLTAQDAAAAAEEEVRRIDLDKATRAVEAAERAIASMTVTAPTDGILVVAEHPWEGRKIQVGDTVWVGLTVMRIPDLTAMQVEAQLADVDDGAVAAGMPVTCTLDMYPDDHFSGRVLEVAAVAQEPARLSVRRAFRVLIALDTTDPERMRPGMSVRAEVVAERREGVLLAPRVALDPGSEPPRLYLAAGGAVPVELGPCTTWACEVRGVEEGTAVASEPRP